MASYDSLLDSPRFNGFQRSIPLRASKVHLGPFRATQIWNEIIEHLKSKVEVKRRRYKMRNYENCFCGTDAVDVVLHYLLSDRNTFSSDLSREKAIKLCQALMDRNVFSPVSSRTSEIKKTFDDSHSKLYRFVGPDLEHEEENRIVESEESDEDQNYSIVVDCRSKSDEMRIDSSVEPDLIEDGVICNPIAVNKKGQVLQEILSLQNSYSRRRSRSSLKCANTSMLMRSMKEKHDVSPEALEDLWKEVALCQLLTLIDLPFLDGLLVDEKPSKKFIKHNLIISNVVAKHWNIPSPSTGQDPFMSSALGCIECLPKGISILENSFVRDTNPAAKLQAFHIISEHYTTQLDESLLPERFIDLHLAVLNFILQQTDQKALEALQLDMILLPWHVREELQRLLRFMAAVKNESMQIDAKDDNEVHLLNTFTDSIMKHKVVAPKLARILVGFMVQNVEEIFSVPKDIRDRVNSRIDDLRTGEVSPVRENTYCQQVSPQEYEQQATECTQNALVAMMNDILDNTELSLKEKKQKLRQFQKHHPSLYDIHFTGML
ncbi:DEP domain-containing protein 7-like isoform X1 [Pecten maximus]|uniref:DEP domain-containing protein 7-like isoform X1 n=1 Tax=Pecten maximus TaxID=6579 RepID=UPI001458A1BD|nr:DEP domain-containing protein 7-like isoform X1 [Pecten maximus]